VEMGDSKPKYNSKPPFLDEWRRNSKRM